MNNPEAAVEARRQGIEAYLAYRRDGGENQNPGAQLSARVMQAVQQKNTAELRNQLDQYLGENAETWATAMIPKLQAILDGDRHPEFADNPELDYDDAAELRLLLERLRDQGL